MYVIVLADFVVHLKFSNSAVAKLSAVMLHFNFTRHETTNSTHNFFLFITKALQVMLRLLFCLLSHQIKD